MPHLVPGFLAIATAGPAHGGPSLSAARIPFQAGRSSVASPPGLELATWGLGADRPKSGEPLLLSRTNRAHEGSVSAHRVGSWMVEGAWDRLAEMLPPFGALGLTRGGYALVADSMGFRQLYVLQGPGWTALSTSARALGALNGFALDPDAVRLQSLLGWQLAQRTLFAEVEKLRPGDSVHVMNGEASVQTREPLRYERVSLERAVDQAAGILRSLLSDYLDENPDPTLQLTGGQDSRIILSAIPQLRRKGLKTMTLAVPGSPDADVAAQLSARYGMRHTVRTLDGLAQLSPAESFQRVCDAARRLDCMADPIAKAATLWAEEQFDQGNRISGLGGEIARGFYYTGRVRSVPVTRARVEQLVRWRMFANEAVEGGALDPAFTASALPRAMDAVHQALTDRRLDWYAATDDLYYRHRMQRWAGLGESAVCFDRSIVNPMLDDRFLGIAEALHPQDKQDSQFLGRLQVALDGELARLPLDNRPPPVVYANPGPISLMRKQTAKTVMTARKVHQRVTGAHRPPPGGAILADRLLEFLRSEPETLDPVRGRGIFDDRWLDGLGAGSIRAQPSSLAFLVNLLVAVGSEGAHENGPRADPRPFLLAGE